MLLSCPDSGMAEDWFDPQFSVAPQTPQSPQCNCPCSQKRPSEVQLPLETPTVGPPSQTTISKTPDIPKPPQVTQFLPQIRQGVQEFTQLLSPGWQKIIQQQKVPKLPPSVQRPTVDPPSQTTSSEILPKPPQEPQFQSQMRQGVKEFSELLRPYLQNVQQVSRPKDPQMPKKPATSPPPTESPTSSIVPVDKSEPSSNQPTKGTDPPPAQRPPISPYLFALSPPGNPYALSWYHPFKQLGSLRATAPPVKKQQQQKVPDLKLPPTPQPSTTVPSKSPVALVWYPKPPVLPSFATTVPPVKTPAHTTRKLPVTSATAPKIQNVQTAYRPHQNAYPAVFILNPFLHPNPENWQSFMSGESLPFIVGPAPIWEPFQSPDLSSQYLGQGQSPSHGQKQH